MRQPEREKAVITPETVVHQVAFPAAAEQQTIVKTEKEIPYRFIGEAFNTYLLVESGDDLFLVDKHAAHERMIFEKLLKEQEAQRPAHQQMLVPEQIRLDQDEMAFAVENSKDFERIGFELEAFGEREIILRSRPVCLTGETAVDAFTEILSDWMRGKKNICTERENHALKTVACKAAIKAGNINNSEELKALVHN